MERSVESFADGSDIAMSFSEMSLEKEYDEEELKTVASKMSPRVSSLLESNEAALDNLLSRNHQTWLEEEEKFGAKLTADDGSDEEDGIEEELNRLANAEQLLRDELEMSDMGFGFLSYLDVEGSEEDSSEGEQGSHNEDYEINHAEQSGGESNHSHESIHIINARSTSEQQLFSDTNDVEPEMNPGTPHLQQQQQKQGSEISADARGTPEESKNLNSSLESSSNRMRSYSLYDHATFIGLLFDDTDLGYPTCPLLTKDDAVYFCKISDDCDLTQNHDVDRSEERTSRFEQEAVKELDKCFREYVKPMTSSALCRIYTGLEEGTKNIANKNRKVRGKKSEIEEKDQDDIGISIKDSDGSGIEAKQEIIPVRTIAIQVRPDVLVGAVMDAIYTSIISLNGEVTKRQGGHLRALVPGRWIKESSYLPFRYSPAVENADMFGSPASLSKGDFMNGMVFLPPLVIDAQLCTKKKSLFAERVLLIRAFRISEGQVLDHDAAVCPRSPPHAASTKKDRRESDLSTELIRPNNILRECSSLFQRMKTVATVGGKIGFDMGELLEDDHAVEESLPLSDITEVSGFRKLLTSPMKLFSPKSQKAKKQHSPKRNPRKKKQEALNVRFETDDRPLIGVGAAQKLASKKLLSTFIETSSVMDKDASTDPIAALSEGDWPFIQSAWLFLSDCLNELDNRDLSFSSLTSSAFGAFPALPTLDVHYCSQIKEICKENMVASLLKSAHELETYAKEAEYATAKLMQVLEPMLLSYDEELPQIPEKTPLTAYPLDFVAPEVTSPPWGQKVIEALNLITTKSPSTHEFIVDSNRQNQTAKLAFQSPSEETNHDKFNSEFQRARDSVNMVLNAFQKQYDDELSIRLERKNCQVMDRLGKMQAYRREAIMALRGSYGINILATKAADRFHSYAKDFAKSHSINENELQSSSYIFPASDQVPLLSCRVIYGGSTGICYVTYFELLLVMQSIPLVGGSHVNLVRLSEIDVEVKSGKKSRLNPVPSILVVKRKHSAQELFSFRPSAGAHLFKDFVEIVKEISQESPEAITFSSENRLLSMVNERRSVESSTTTTLGEM